MLLGQGLGRRHQRPLMTVLDGAEQRVQGNHRLARADLTHEQPLHRARTAEILIQDGDRRLLVAGQRERQHRREPPRRELPFPGQGHGVSAPAALPATAQESQLDEQKLLEGQAPAPQGLLSISGEVHRGHGATALGQPLVGPQPRGQWLTDMLEVAGVSADQGEDLSRGQALGGRILARPARRAGAPAGSADRFAGLGVALHAESVAGLELPVQHQPRPGPVAPRQPRLVEEGDLHDSRPVGHRGLDQRPHAAPAHRARGDAPHLDHDRGHLPGNQLGHRARLAAVTGKVLEQLTDSAQAERLGGPGRLGSLDLEGAVQTRGPRVADRCRGELRRIQRAGRGEGGRAGHLHRDDDRTAGRRRPRCRGEGASPAGTTTGAAAGATTRAGAGPYSAASSHQ